MNQLDVLLAAQATLPSTTSPDVNLIHAEDRLPFTVRVVRTEAELWKAVEIRHSAYARHVPEFAETLTRPEPLDGENGVVVLLAESKLNGAALGTMRIQTNYFKPLTLEQSIVLPEWLHGKTLAEATRLGVTDDRSGRVVKTALFKAFYELCDNMGVEWMVVAGRSPIDRQYQRLLFEDVYPGQGFIPLRHAGNMPHRVMALRVPDVEPKWKVASHPLYDYFFNTIHADIMTNVPSGDELPMLRRNKEEAVDEMHMA